MITFWFTLAVAIDGVLLAMLLQEIEGPVWASVFAGVWTTFWLCIALSWPGT